MTSQVELIETLKERIIQLEAELGRGEKLPMTLAKKIWPKQQEILGIMLKRPIAYYETIATVIYDGDVDFNTIKVHIHLLRKQLRPFNIEIETLWGKGVFMTDEMKQKLRSLP